MYNKCHLFVLSCTYHFQYFIESVKWISVKQNYCYMLAGHVSSNALTMFNITKFPLDILQQNLSALQLHNSGATQVTSN